MSKLKPIRVFWSPFSERFYATRSYRAEGNTIIVTGEQFDVTNDIAYAVIKHDIEFKENNDV